MEHIPDDVSPTPAQFIESRIIGIRTVVAPGETARPQKFFDKVLVDSRTGAIVDKQGNPTGENISDPKFSAGSSQRGESASERAGKGAGYRGGIERTASLTLGEKLEQDIERSNVAAAKEKPADSQSVPQPTDGEVLTRKPKPLLIDADPEREAKREAALQASLDRYGDPDAASQLEKGSYGTVTLPDGTEAMHTHGDVIRVPQQSIRPAQAKPGELPKGFTPFKKQPTSELARARIAASQEVDVARESYRTAKTSAERESASANLLQATQTLHRLSKGNRSATKPR
jgi:hypothetical protein